MTANAIPATVTDKASWVDLTELDRRGEGLTPARFPFHAVIVPCGWTQGNAEDCGTNACVLGPDPLQAPSHNHEDQWTRLHAPRLAVRQAKQGEDSASLGLSATLPGGLWKGALGCAPPSV